MTLNPKWVEQVLRDRGIKSGSTQAIGDYLGTLTESDLDHVGRLIRDVQFGTEVGGELDAMLQAIANHATASESKASGKGAEMKVASPMRTRNGEPTLDPDQMSFLRRHSERIFASKAALKVELDILRKASDGDTPTYTVLIEMAPVAKEGGSFEWARKVPFQFTKKELPLLAAVLLGYARSPLKCGNHGPAGDKFLEVREQGRSFFVKLGQAGKFIAMPVEAPDVHAWAQICLIALKLNAPELDGASHLALLRRIGMMHDAPAKENAP